MLRQVVAAFHHITELEAHGINRNDVQRLSDAGAQVIFVAINGGRDGGDWSKQVYWHYHETNMRMRAKAGKVWVVSADNCFPMDIPCSAPSGVLTPNGDWAAKANDEGEQVVVHTIELQ